MEVDIKIDEFTPCLIERSTGEILNTKYFRITKEDVSNLDWKFNWNLPFKTKDCEVVALSLENSNDYEGLIAYKVMQKDKSVEVMLTESAPYNVGRAGKYDGVGAHLFAIAIKKSIEEGFGGHIYYIAKSNLISHYEKELGAVLINSRTRLMEVDEQAANRIYKLYMREAD